MTATEFNEVRKHYKIYCLSEYSMTGGRSPKNIQGTIENTSNGCI